MVGVSTRKWNEGLFPSDAGEHRDLPIFDTLEVVTDNGHGMMVQSQLSVSLRVVRDLYFGQYPILQMSGFKDEISGGVITNAFTVGVLSPDDVEKNWLKIEKEEDAPINPVLTLTGRIAWPE